MVGVLLVPLKTNQEVTSKETPPNAVLRNLHRRTCTPGKAGGSRIFKLQGTLESGPMA